MFTDFNTDNKQQLRLWIWLAPITIALVAGLIYGLNINGENSVDTFAKNPIANHVVMIQTDPNIQDNYVPYLIVSVKKEAGTVIAKSGKKAYNLHSKESIISLGKFNKGGEEFHPEEYEMDLSSAKIVAIAKYEDTEIELQEPAVVNN